MHVLDISPVDHVVHMLSRAISVKETQLIENVASDLDIGREDASSAVRIVSPKDEDTGKLNEEECLDWSAINSKNQVLEIHTEAQAGQRIGNSMNNPTGDLTGDSRNEADIINSLKGISSYEDFIEHLDQQLDKIEAELVIVLRVSTFVLEDNEKPKNSKVQQTLELLEGIHDLRER
ncbi:hypothetical protein Acr_13g0006670 [Actinidia rufa]|uniref:Uncharacterized protein n=1 Tax=Actinidia rufa TaxID=165716 RepID=A0A7J0FLJ6_9ERIC|nr:hypothetical protein Acr_13g0006670 [Actinidia rufa]